MAKHEGKEEGGAQGEEEAPEQRQLVINGHGRFELRLSKEAREARRKAKEEREAKIAEEEQERRMQRIKRKQVSEELLMAERPGLDAAGGLHGALQLEKQAERESRKRIKERRLAEEAVKARRTGPERSSRPGTPGG